MRSPSKVNTVLLVLLSCAWLYTEIVEYNARKEHEHAVDKFMERGDRFTLQHGQKLEARIEKLEKLEEAEHGISLQ